MSHMRGRGGLHPPQTPTQQVAAPSQLPPRLPLDELREDMRLLERPITRDDIKKPTPEFVQSLYGFFIEKAFGTTADDLRQPTFGCLDELANPEILDDAVPVLQFFRACQRLFTAAQWHDFRRSDITHPLPGRLHWQLSALVNFLKFRENRLHELLDMAEAQDAIRRDLAEQEQKNAQVEAGISAVEAKIAADADSAAREKQLVDAKGKEVAEVEGRNVQLNDETKESKTNLQTAVDMISKLNFNKMTLTQEEEALKGTVCSSPDRMKSEIEELRERVESEREALEVAQRNTTETAEREGRLSGAATEVVNVCEISEETVESSEAREKLESAVSSQTQKIDEYAREKVTFAGMQSHLGKQTQYMAQSIERIRQQRDGLKSKERDAEDKLADEERAIVRVIDSSKTKMMQNKKAQSEITQNILELVQALSEDIGEATRQMSSAGRALDEHYKEVARTNDLIETDNRSAIEELQRQVQSC